MSVGGTMAKNQTCGRQGTSTEQDTRFSDKEKKLMKQMKFGDCLTQQVDMSKVKLDVLKPWITQKITEILKMEDDVVIDYVNNQLEEKRAAVTAACRRQPSQRAAAPLLRTPLAFSIGIYGEIT
ncbi:Serine/arginine repetitive matrix protein 1 [Papilio machaon]|uniref:Serine/arginine repetitive matrix protein 1 n=1 Tax=Papilio machaon TaxID=76193 RepID=A0A194R6C5_PAPMA|nr:Serine/arginine repetitive matrix protein 1 [Papilio machaon]